jgi:hypothetical protein
VSAKTSSIINERLSNPTNSFSLNSFGENDFSLTIDIFQKSAKIAQIGFKTKGNEKFQKTVFKISGLFIGKTPLEAEELTFNSCLEKINAAPEEQSFVLYAWTVLQDVISKLPSNDPLSKAKEKIGRLQDEFPVHPKPFDFED